MIRKLPSGKYRLYSLKKNPRTGRRRNLGTFATRAAAECCAAHATSPFAEQVSTLGQAPDAVARIVAGRLAGAA